MISSVLSVFIYLDLIIILQVDAFGTGLRMIRIYLHSKFDKVTENDRRVYFGKRSKELGLIIRS